MPAATPARRERLRARIGALLRGRFFLRFHVSLILLFTFCAGLVASRLLLGVGLYSLWLRYLLCMLIAYVAFLAAVRIWLGYIRALAFAEVALPAAETDARAATRPGRERGASGDLLPNLDLGGFGGGFGGGGGGGGAAMPMVSGGGGDFAGGGASGSFAAPDAGAGLPSGGGSWLPEIKAPDLDLGDGDGLIVLLLALLALLAVVGSAFWLIWAGPEILIEAAFQAMLAGGLLKSLRATESSGWMGVVVRKTCLPFLAVLIAALLFAWVGQGAYPGAKTFREVVRAAWLGDESDPQAVRDPDDEVAYADEDRRKLGAVTPGSAVELRSRAVSLLKRRAERLAWLKRFDDSVAAYDAALALISARDPPNLQSERIDAMRIKAATLADAGKVEEAIAAHAAVREQWSDSADPEMQWRAAWSALQEGSLRERREAGSGQDLFAQVGRKYATSLDARVRAQVSESWRLQGLALLFGAKQGPAGTTPQSLARALECYRAAIAAAPASSWPASQAWGELAYVRYLAGDESGAQEALGHVLPAHAASLRTDLLEYADWQALARDSGFRQWIATQLKGKDG